MLTTIFNDSEVVTISTKDIHLYPKYDILRTLFLEYNDPAEKARGHFQTIQKYEICNNKM